MKKLFLFCFVVCLTVVVSAQKVYFLYLQTDDQSPFYVRMADKIHSSSTSGYLILPNLTDSTYAIGLGFAKSTQPETRFAVTINQKDKGYLIKNFTEGLSLFDLQDLSIVKSVSAITDNTVYETKTDKFSSVLSKAADDPSLLKVPVTKKEEPKAKPNDKEVVTKTVEEAKPIGEAAVVTAVVTKPAENTEIKQEKNEEPAKTEKAAAPETKTAEATPAETKTEDVKKPDVKEETAAATVVPTVEFKPSIIIRKSESSTTEGFGVVFYDRMDDKTDTIRILIPPSKINITEQTASYPEVEKKEYQPASNTEAEKKDTKSEQLLPTSEAKGNTDAKAGVAVATAATVGNCKASATDKDFMKLRKNMAAEDNDEAMIDEARKVYKTKCFSVEQLRYLSTLFLSSAAKYQFFDASYNYVSDKQNFGSLQNEIKDEYYLKRFKALVGE